MRSKAFGSFLLMAVFAIPASAYRMSAWVPAWDTKALASMQLNAGKLNETNPGWYTIAADGGVTKNWGAEDSTMRAALSGTELMPTIKNYINDLGDFDGALVARVVASPELREKHAETITQLVVDKGFDGIDIDYESMPSAAKNDFSAFIQILGAKLHGARKKLSVTVHAKTTDAGNWSGAASQDWRALGSAADTIKVMAYDKHYSGSLAGAIAPLDWLENVASYASSAIPSGKAIIGLPWYGYDWSGTSARTIVYPDAMNLAATKGAQVSHDVSGEATFTYEGRTVFFQDAQAYAKKVEMIAAKFPRIAGFAHWRVGAEDPAIWNKVAELKTNSTTQGGTPATASFVINGPASIAARAGDEATGSFGLVAVNGFSGTATATIDQIDTFPGTITFDGATASASSPAVLRVVPSGHAYPGPYRIVVRLRDSDIVSSMNVTVNIAVVPQPAPAAGSFTVSSSDSVLAQRGTTANAIVSIRSIGGFTGTVSLAAEMMDAFGGSVSLTDSTLTAGQSAELRMVVPGNAPAGTYRVKVRATNGTTSKDTIVLLTIEGQSKRRSTR